MVFNNINKSSDQVSLKIGVLVLILVIFHMYFLNSGSSKKNPIKYTSFMILAYSILIPYILRTSPVLYGKYMKIFVTLMIVILDWFSFHEDMSRFSEKKLCIFGNCRFNSKVTGLLAHIADTISLSILLVPNIKGYQTRSVIVGTLVVYLAYGCKIIEQMTKDGSVSDLRGKTKKDKCLQSRIMRNSWRGGINDIITILGILLAWQSLFTCENENCKKSNFPINQVYNLFNSLDNKNKNIYYMILAKIIVLDIGTTIYPTYTNYINTSYQHGRMTAKEFGLPDCFDDPED